MKEIHVNNSNYIFIGERISNGINISVYCIREGIYVVRANRIQLSGFILANKNDGCHKCIYDVYGCFCLCRKITGIYCAEIRNILHYAGRDPHNIHWSKEC
jgi:hypothetical protein